MRTTWARLTVVGVLTLGTRAVFGAAPQYLEDPFGDDDFKDTPLILDVAHPTNGRGELSLMFATSVIDKYTQHRGGILDFNYHFLDTFGLGLSFGFMHGELTNIVTDAEGIIGNKMEKCLSEGECENINPNVPDYRQITGVIQLVGIWSPLYGKINVVSELDVNLQIYGLLGGGVNGTRTIEAAAKPGAVTSTDYQLSGHKLGAGGLFDNLKPHATAGFGLRVFLFDWLDLRGEMRGIFFRDSFEFDAEAGKEAYTSSFFFTHVGLGFILF